MSEAKIAGTRLTGAEIMWATLEGEGVREVFGYPGGAILPVYDALRKFPIRHILVRHEQGAAHMADGFARASGKIGVAIATSGPGATNLVTGIATAMLDSVPMLCITGQVSSKALGSDAFQEVDITGITLPITKHNYLVTRAEDIAPTIREAIQVALSGRPGPVLVDITKDAQQNTADFDFEAAAPKAYRPHPMLRSEHTSVLEAVSLIRSAKRPIILAGHGIIQSGAREQVLALAERLQIPIATTLLGLGGVPATHPLQLGMMGMHGESWVNNAIQSSDLLIACGMRFDDRVTGTLATYAPDAKKIHIEIDPAEINKNVKVDVALIGDLAEMLEILLPHLSPISGESAWVREVNAMKGESAVRDIQNLPDTGHLYAAHVMHDLWHATNGRAVVATDVGQHQMWEAQYYKHEDPRSLITSGGLGTMGFALPAGIGAKVGAPEKEVWVIAGDGGFQMTACELSTIAQENLDINIAVVNNGYLGMVRQWQEFFYEKNYESSPILSPDFVKLAEAHGIPGITVRTRAEVAPAVEAARKHKGPFLVHFLVEKEDSVYPMIPAGSALHEMIRRPEKNPLIETAQD
ncbi:biosynthetic-type acetolactate synthase large subunit [Silvibacterium dinghuense]|uniref:Acetolactate synthase n=1 Tax=Silvibacterium dinghuense TaxID=1560006 RepID=A0A4Q1SBD1_9BACT|nr:biosynthetic-type acetolactate synthase large subunit [Silvibacterium dinghuense]RXS94438.1 biosynthetic-type acetolactate synthase large subunit [Silvibacterium dinghuense]GGH16093.1 acetolactate synthase [Silvibacterium dinghuense]